jgi:hypothetical protein
MPLRAELPREPAPTEADGAISPCVRGSDIKREMLLTTVTW